MLFPALEEKLRKARLALDGATSESVIELCKRYLTLLAEYRSQLYTLPDTVDLNPRPKTSSGAAANDLRKTVRASIEQTARERVRAEALILSLTAISGYGAVETFNRQQYRGRADWQLSAGGVSFKDGTVVRKMTMQEAVETAGRLRREAYVAASAADTGQWQSGSPEFSQPSAQPVERSR